MRKLLVVLVLVCIMSGLLAAGEITRTLYFNEPQLSQIANYNRITMQGCLTIANPGEPMLPRKGLSLLLPAGEEAISITYNLGDRIKLDGFFDVEPGRRQYPLSYSGPTEPTAPNEEIYNSNNKYPSQVESGINTHYFRGHSIAFVDVCPFEYYPSSGELYYYPEIEITITSRISGKAQTAYSRFLRTDVSTHARLTGMVENPDELSVLYGQSSMDVDDEGNYEYLIITDQNLLSSLNALAGQKNITGMLTEIMLVEDILAEYSGGDNPEKIRNCIIDQYINHGIDYVLLAGDDEILPHRGFYDDAGGYENEYDVAADIYFSNLDGNWNDDGDNRWGEPGEDDLVGEVFIGRMAVDTPTEAANFINKTLMYQYQPCVADIEKALMCGEDLGWSVWGYEYKEEIRLGSSNWGYETSGLPPNIDCQTLYDFYGNWSPLGDLAPILNNGMNLVNHLGHADVTYMLKLYNSNITDVNFTNNGVDNGFYIVYSQGCYCGSFDNRTAYGGYGPDCISEMWTTLEHGPVAIISNSRYGWGDTDGTNGSSQYFDRQFFDAMFGEYIYRIGEVQMDAKVDNIPYIGFAQNRWCFYCSNLFADPTLDIWTSQPVQVTALHDDVFVIGNDEFQISLTDSENEPIVGSLIGLSIDGACVAREITDENGIATLNIFGTIEEPGEMTLMVTGHNLATYETIIDIIPPEGPYVILEDCIIDDETGGNNNSLLDYGEVAELWLSMENVGNETALNVYAEIFSTDPYLNIIDNTAVFGDLAAGEIGQGQDSYTIAVSPNCPDGHNISLSIESHADNYGETWQQFISLANHAPLVSLAGCNIDDDYMGDGDGKLDPGESVEFYPIIANDGSSDLLEFMGRLFTNDPYITITGHSAPGGPIPSGEQAGLNAPLLMTVDSECPDPHEVSFTLSLNGDNGYFSSLMITLMVGGFDDDFESGEGEWVHSNVDGGFTDQWHMSTTRNHSQAGQYSWKCGDTGSGDYDNLLDAGLVSPTFDLNGNCFLRYWQWIDSETSNAYPDYAYDGGIIEISVNDGDTWNQIVPLGDYPFLIRTGGTPGPFPAETPCYAGVSDWHEAVFDLSGYTGSSVMIRFRFGTDGAVVREGWYIDDVRLTSATTYPAPQDLVVNIDDAEQVVLSWSAPQTGSPDGYNIYRCENSGDYGIDPVNDVPVTELSFIDLECNRLLNNYYVVTAVYESDVESNYSNEAFLPAMPTSVDENEIMLPQVYELMQNFPNPFNSITVIRFNLPEPSQVSLTVYDILGRKITTLVDEYRDAGYHQVSWEASAYATGIYFYKINAGDYNRSRKMIMIK